MGLFHSVLFSAAGPPPEQDVPLPVPKKTKVYVDQTQRERDQAPQIHRTFQRDLCKLRLETARAYVKTLTDGIMVRSQVIVVLES
jgi:Bardet-Biedl syndrome 1 protein